MYEILKFLQNRHIYLILWPFPSSKSIVMIMVTANGSGIVSSNLNLLRIFIFKFQKWSQDAIVIKCQIKYFSLY